MLKPLDFPVADGPVGKEGSKAALAGVQDRCGSRDVQVGFLLSGETGIGKILRRRTASYCHGHVLPAATAAKFSVAGTDGCSGFRRELCPQNGVPDAASGFPQRCLPQAVIVDATGNQGLQAIDGQELAVRIRRRCEAFGDPDAGSLQSPGQLAKGGVLPPDPWNVGKTGSVEPQDMGVGQGSLRC